MAPGAIVKQIRSSAGLSQRSFAESIGICQSAVGYYESGKHRVSDVIWEKIKSVYHDVIVQLAIPEEMPNEAKKELPPQSEELRRIRLASGLSQREFAESIGVSKSGSTPNLMVHHGNLGGDDLSVTDFVGDSSPGRGPLSHSLRLCQLLYKGSQGCRL